MRSLGVLTAVAVVGVVVLSAAIPVLDPYVPIPLAAVYNFWLLATITLVVASLVVACFRFFGYITGGHGR